MSLAVFLETGIAEPTDAKAKTSFWSNAKSTNAGQPSSTSSGNTKPSTNKNTEVSFWSRSGNTAGKTPSNSIQKGVSDKSVESTQIIATENTYTSTSPPPTRSASGNKITGTWVNKSATWHFHANGTATVTIPTLNRNGTATTYLNWEANPADGSFKYTITRATLTGSQNCDGVFDYDKPMNKSYSEPFKCDGNTLTIGTEVLHRN